MTKEINDILRAFKVAQQEGRKTALATVVHVEGSSYRRPGARMLVEDNGRLTGAISGGCLEGDALRKALLAIHQQQNKLVTYNTLHEDDIEFGVQLGCNGIVHILFEPLDPNQPDNPISLLEKFYPGRENVVLVTLFSLKNNFGPQPGTCLSLNAELFETNIKDKRFANTVGEDAKQVLSNQSSLLKEYYEHELTAFIEFLQPPVSLIIVGAGNDALPVVDMATILGWQITIVDGRTTHATVTRFPRAHKIIVGKPAETVKQISIDERTVFILMTHNYNYDIEMMRLLLQTETRYIGLLGPKKRLHRMLNELEDNGFRITDQQKTRIYGPIGLDVGAEVAEEIALSVLAEIKSVLAQRPGTFLRNKLDEIHHRSGSINDEVKKFSNKTN